jgi:tetratricopeptide (TPR) repeat protein
MGGNVNDNRSPAEPSYDPGMSLDGRVVDARVWWAAALGLMLGATLQAQLAVGPASPQAAVVRSLRGQPLAPPDPLPNREALERDLRQAESVRDPNTADAIIWIGRRQAYLWRYQDAIETFSRGARLYAEDPRMYRHRGHRYLTVRRIAEAREDLERAAALIAGRPDEIEPDGAPNAAGKPRSTLHFNVWYHLGLAYYLQAQYDRAAGAWMHCLRVSTNDDSVVAATDWLWMTLMRLDRRGEAAQLLDRITPTMDILENGAYHRRLLMYKGLATPESLLDASASDDTTVATQGYGVANYYLVNGQPERAVPILERITRGRGWNAFGFLAAEADLARMRRP